MITVRQANEADAEMLWIWANDEVVRQSAFSSDSISWSDHIDWFHSKLNDPKCRIYIGEDESGQAIGQVRFDVCGIRAEIDISVAPHRRKRGIGKVLLPLCIEAFGQSTRIVRFDAYVKLDNVASEAVFRATGFEKASIDQLRHCFHYTYESTG